MALPEDVLRKIAGYLPYEDRITMNRCMSPEYRVVNQLNGANSHDLHVNVTTLRDMFEQLEDATDVFEKTRHVQKLFQFLINASVILFTHTSVKFREVVRERADWFMQMEAYPANIHAWEPELANECILLATQVYTRVEATPFVKSIPSEKIVISD